MADIIKKLYGGYMSTVADTSIYTPPTGKRTVLKSMTVCNSSPTAQNFFIRLNGIDFVWSRSIKPYETLVIPVFDQVLFSGQTITVWAQTANTIHVRLSGYDTDRTDLITFRFRATTSDITVSSGKFLVKSIAICTAANDPITFDMKFGSNYIICNHPLKPLDTMLIPTLDQIIESGEGIASKVSNTNTAVFVHINAQVVT
ncbi:hypothetical protein [Paenibacillus sp. W2I17]|uniref:hypothetical protein n=1 Tax=Paenibacillus sp. W2I17 TaxID=3042311 RepID=UPI0027832F3E|nr:hypothetical protein [Paenibacillus sp. W2I17]MDQ0658746.1 hypothetical protein [Paenibacillus sp. W2I17]